MVLTHSPYFSKMLNTCYLAIIACLPFLGTMTCIMLFFSEFCMDLFKEVPDPSYPGCTGGNLTVAHYCRTRGFQDTLQTLGNRSRRSFGSSWCKQLSNALHNDDTSSQGENWNSVMWDVQVATSYASTILFIVYVFASTLLFAQLVSTAMLPARADDATHGRFLA